ncbi:inositol monophosphatase family protein [Actinoplanes sp. CA-142083]|uniref:inositol monophosphatase family protein n=1 Tax=Actinoplanes sp. CA-142083 TaxID=3239903 RepID=UPI003D91992E
MPSGDLELAVAAALAGASVVRAAFGAPLDRFDKGAGDFATAADIDAEKAILDLLRAARPGDAVLGEETGLSTTLALAWVAAGRRAAYVTDGSLRDSVHFAPGIALCEAAGCVVTGLRGEPWQQENAGLLAAADRETHAALLAVIGS